MIHRFTLLFFYSLFCTIATAQEKLFINELMQSNVDFMMVNHDFPDSWVELYNGSDKTVAVRNYRISPTNVYADAYPLSSSAVDLQPGAHLTLYCDKTTGTPFHYNFNLEAGKGALYLFNQSGEIIDSISYPKMPAPNVAYGRVTDGSELTYLYDTATIQPTLASCSPGDSVTFIATDASVIVPTHRSNQQSIAAIYDATGKKISAIHKGVNIILYSDGTRRKNICK